MLRRHVLCAATLIMQSTPQPVLARVPPSPISFVPRWVTLLRVAVALGGIALVAWLVVREDAGRLWQVLLGAASALPLAFALEVGRLLMETGASRAALGARRAAVPTSRLFLAQLVAHALLNVAPGGRSSAEVAKAALLSTWVGGAEAAAAGAVLQTATFVAVGMVSGICGAVIMALGLGGRTGDLLGVLLFGNMALLLFMGLGLRWVMRSRRLLGWLRRRLVKRADLIARFAAAVDAGGPLAFGPACFLVLGMTFQVAQMWVLAKAVGGTGGLAGAFAAQGVHLVTASVAVFVPGQLGAREAAFGLSAEAMGLQGTTAVVAATSIAMLAHVTQLVLAAIGFAVLLVWRRQPRIRANRPPKPVTAPGA